MTTLQVLMKTQ